MQPRHVTDINKIILHCSDSSFGNRGLIDQWHKEQGWDMIGYHYVIGNGYLTKHGKYQSKLDGLVEDGRPIEYQGAHCFGQNQDSIGICLIGDRLFSPEQLFVALPMLISTIRLSYLTGLKVYPHSKYSTKSCPNISADVIDFIGKD